MASDLKQSSAHLQFADAGSLIVVDGSLASLDQLLQALEGQGQVLVLDPSTDPIGQILQAAAAQGPLDAIHLLSHGSSGSIRIAGQSYGPQDLASLGSALAPGGDLLLYGCDVAASQSGLDFVQELARLTRVDVAASSDRTGASGNWTLELSVGTIEAQPLAAPEWQGDLAISITGTKVNEGSPFAPFTVTGLSAGQIAILGVSDKTTAGMVNAGIKVSLDNGATWVDYAGSITLPSNFTSTSKLLVAVSDSPETNGSITIEGIERYQLVLNLLPTSTSFQVETPNFLLAGESERYTTTQLAGSKSVFGFGGSWAEMDSFTRTLVLGSQTIGKITFPRPTDYNIYGGANGSKFVTASDEAPVTISLSVPQNYFGFWWSAGDDENILEFYKGDQLIETFKAELMNEKFPEAQFGNPYAKDEDGLKSSTLLPQDQQANQGEKYAFLNFFMKAGQTFDKVVMRGSNFEFDNLTFLKTASTGTVGEGTIIDDGSGVYLKLDASGNPIVDANGSFVNDPTAFVDNDYDNTPSLNDCAYVAPINLLANDVASTSSATLDPASIKLYSSLTSSGTGEGGSSLTTAMGEFKLTPSGLMFFNPNASFNGATDKISIYYTVKDSAGSESVRTAISLDAAAVTAPMASNGGAVIPWRQTDANASELFNYDADGNKVTATRTATGTGVATATSLTVNLQTNSDNDVGGDKVMAPVQAKLKIDTTPVTASSGNNLAMGLQIPDSLNYGDFVDLAGVTNSVTAADLRSNPYDDGKSTIKTWVGNLGADASQTDPTKDYYTSQQVDIQQHWTDFDPMVNSWVKFQTGSLTPLLNKATATAWQIGTITLSFQNPNGGGLGVDNPLIHLANLGGGDFGNSAGTRFGNVGAQLQLASAIDSSGNAITGTTLSKLSGDANMTVTGNTIGHPKGATSNGTVKINGTGVASITFNVLMKGYSETDGKTVDDTTYPGNFNGYNNPDLFYLSTSAFIGPDSLGPTTTGAGADALKATKVCGVNNVVVNEGSPYAIFEVGGFEGSLINGLSLSSGTGSYGVDTGTALEYYDPSANNGQGQWIPYAGGAITIPENGDGSEYMPTKLLVRVAITNDAPADNGEQLTLSVTYPSKTDTGTLTIKDDGTGSVFGADNTSGSPDPIDTRFPHTALNDDVPDSTPLTINNLVVNEGSPYAIFTVTGKEGQTLSLGSLTSGTGSSGLDTGVAGDTSTTPLEYWNGKDWVTYTPGQAIRLGLGSDNLLDPATSASLLVRVAVKPDLLNEISEQLSLTATNTGGVASTGTLDIVDRSNGSLFGPSNTTGTPDPVGSPGVPEWLDDDTPDSRPVAINSVTVNEASPFAVFTVSAAAGQRVVLGQPSSGSAAVGTDTGTGLEYYNPATSQWTAYIPGSQVETPTSGSFLVRVALVQDAPFEGPETFTITASNVNGDAATGTGTIVDDGTGTLFATRADKPGTTAINEAVTGVNSDGTPLLDTSTVKDDDRPIAVNNVAVNEASPYIVFTVSGGAGQAVKLSTANITATLGSDTSPAMQVYNGSAWVDYIRGSEVPIGANGQLLVRLAVTPDAQSEGTEKFNLIATTLSNKTAKGVGSISDDGTGSLFAATNTTGTPDPLGSPALPNTLTALDQDGAPPQTCWDLGTTEVTQGLNLAFNEYVDPSSIDLDPAAAGQQFSRDIFDSTNVKLGSYVARADGTITFEAAPAFRGTGVGPIDITLSVKAYKLDSNKQILLDESGDPVPDNTVAPRIEQHKVGLGASSNSYVPTGATYTGPGHVLHGGYQQGTAWSREAMYLTRALIDSWIDPSDQADPKFGVNRNVLLEAPAPIKFYDPVSGVDRSAATLQKIKDAFLPAYQAIEPSLDSVAWVEGSYNGKPFWDLIWYDSKNPLKPLTNWTSTTDAAASVGRGFWLVSQPESTLSEPKTSGAWSRGDFWGNSLSTLTNVSVLRDVHTFGVALTEVCGVNNVTVNEGSPYAIFEVGGFEGGTISALTLASGTGTLGVDTASGLEYFNGSAWVAYSGQPVTIPSDGDNDPYEPTKLLVRVPISNDDPLETVNGVGETLTLKANYGFGAEKTGTLTILDNGSGPVFGEANTTGTPDNPATSSDPSVPDFLDDDFRPTAPETCWSVTSVNIADKFKLGNFEAIDFSSVDLDIFTDGRQTSLTVQLNGADVGTYSVNSQGQVVFSGTSAFRGQAPEVFYSVDVVNKNTGGFIRKELAGFQVGADDVKTLYETKQINAVLFDYNFFSPGKDSYLVGAADNKGKQYPSTIGKTFKVWDHSSGSTITAELASEIAALYLPIVQSVYPSVDKLVVATEEIMSGDFTILMYGYNSTNLLDSKINRNAPEFELWWWDSNVPPGMGDITNSSYVSENFNIPSVYAANVPIQGLPVTEVCGVSSVVVNEGSPWAIFQVGGFETGTISSLAFTGATGTVGVDTGAQVQYYDPNFDNGANQPKGKWIDYNGGPITVPDDGDRTYIEPTKLLVRVAINQDAPYEVKEELKLTATYAFGPVKTGTLTILDDGTGSVFGTANTTGKPDGIGTSTDPSLPTRLDDDRPLAVSSDWVYESAGFASFTVTGAPGQPVTLGLAAGTATDGSDYTNAMQVWNGSAWVDYAPGAVLGSDGALKVRVAVNTDASTETPETFTLSASNTSGLVAVGTATILDGTNPVPYGPSTDNVSQCWLPVTINVLANDVDANGQLVASSVLLSDTPNGVGSTQLNTAYGIYVVNADGTVTFTPVAKLPNGDFFNGVTSAIYYTVMNSAGVRSESSAIHIGDGILSDPVPVQGGTKSNLVQNGMWSIADVTTENRIPAAAGGTNLIINGDFSETGGKVSGLNSKSFAKVYSLISGTSSSKSYAYAALPGWSAKGGGLDTYAAWGNTSGVGSINPAWAGALEPTGANTNQVYFGNNNMWYYTGLAPAFNADGVGLADSANPVKFASVPPTYGNNATPVTISQTVTGLTNGERYRLQFWVTSESGYLGGKYPAPSVAAVDIGGYERTFFEVSTNQLNSSKLGTRYTIDFIAKSASTDISFMSWGHVPIAAAPKTYGMDAGATELILDDVILTLMPPQKQVSQFGTDGVPIMVKTCGINDVIVNEASPWAVFTVNGAEGQKLKLDLLDGSGVEAVDTNALQYLDPTDNTWKPYTPGLELTLPNDNDGTTEKAQILVRVGIVNDAPFEQSEQLKLQASFDNGLVETGTLTILDNGTGNVFLDGNKTATPSAATDTGYPSALNDDRGSGPQVNSIVVNEASPYAVFTLQGVAGAGVNLALGAGGTSTTAELSGAEADIGQTLEFWNAATNAWVAYNAAAPNAIFGSNGQLLVRVAVKQDEPLEVSEDFTLTATYNNKGTTTGITVGAASTGQGVIKDDGTGTIFAAAPADPLVPGAQPVAGVDANGNPQIDTLTPKDFDGISINNLELNEGSPFAVFTVGSPIAGAKVTLALADGKGPVQATVAGDDYANALEVWNPTANNGAGAWNPYTPGQELEMPASGPLLVRTPVKNQVAFEGPEPFTLTATLANNVGGYLAGGSKTGTCTILDNGSGTIFATRADDPATPGNEAVPGVDSSGLPLLDTTTVKDDDDVPLVNDVKVNEGSPFAVFTVTATAGKGLNLSLDTSGSGTGHAVLGTDTASGTGSEPLEYWNGTAWVPYTGTINVTGAMNTDDSHCSTGEASPNFEKSRLIVSSYHSSFFKANEGNFFIAGSSAAADGTTSVLTPQLVSAANGYAYTGEIIDVAASGFIPQHAVATTEGLWVWGGDVDLSDNMINLGMANDPAFKKIVLPTTLNPADINFISGSEAGGLALVMKDGTVWTTLSSAAKGASFFGNGSSTITTGFKQVMTAAGVPLTGITDLEFTCAGITAYNASSKTFYTWGPSVFVGDGSAAKSLKYATPMVSPLPAGTSCIQLQATGSSAGGLGMTYFALANNGQIYVLGKNNEGQAGQGDFTNLSKWSTIKTPDGAGTLKDVAFISMHNATMDEQAASAVLTDGSLLSWGKNNGWRIGIDTDANLVTGEEQITLPTAPAWASSTGVQRVLMIENGGHFSSILPVGSGGLISAVGHNPGGAFGDGSTANRQVYETGTFIGVGASLDNGKCQPENGEPVALLVRVAIKQDTNFEQSETYKLNANYNGGPVASGTGTILDDGTGAVFGPGNSTGTPDAPGSNGIPANFIPDDDRPLTVNNVTVNEASPTIVFTVTGKEGQLFTLGTASGTAVLGQDTGTQLQVLTEICGLQPLTLNVLANDVAATGKTLDPASVRLFSAASGGTGSTSLTINGQGSYAVNTDGTITFTPAAGLLEGTPLTKVFYSVRDSGGLESIRSTIDLNAGATSTDALTPPRGTSGRYVRVEQSGQYLALAEVQVFSGSTNLAQGKTATQSSTGFGGVASRAVDGNTSGNFNNNTVTHTATTGNEWWEVDLGSLQAIDQIAVWNRDSTMGRLTGSTVKILDDQRQVVGSFVLTGAASQTQAFAAPPLAGADGQPLDEKCAYQWVDYTPGTYLTLPDDDDTTSGETASMLVRLAVKQDPNFEVSESFTLKATNTGGTAATGIGTILDDGTGQIFASPTDDPNTPANEAANPDGSPVLDTTTPKDDDRPLTVTGSTVKEPATGGTGYLTFNVSGIEGQPFQLALQSGTATLGDDTDSGSGTEPLEVWDPSANNNQGAWVAYDPANPPVIPQVGASANGETGNLSVRIAVKGDAIAEPVESLTLVASNASGSQASAQGYILDNSSLVAAPVIPATATPISVTGQLVNEASPYLVYTVKGRQGEGLTLDLATTGTGGGHVDPDADLSCHLPVTTVSVLSNDVASTGSAIDPSTVLLFPDATGGSPGVTELLVPGEGTYKANSDGTISFTPIDGLQEGINLSPVYYTVKSVVGGYGRAESEYAKIDLNPGAASSSSGTPQTKAWWEVDLAANVAIDSIKIFNRTDTGQTRLNGATVTILDANKQVVNTYTLSTPALTNETLTTTGATGRYVKVELANNGYLNLAEVQVFSGSTNVALGKTARQSSTGWGGVASRAVDGNTSGNFFATPNPSVTHTDSVLPPVTAGDGTTNGAGARLACQELEYFNGTNWVYYVPGSTVTIPGSANGTPGDLLVRTRVVYNAPYEGPETLNLVATSAAGFRASGTGTIVDDGTGVLNTDAVTNGQPVLDTTTPHKDDRSPGIPLIDNVTVNEGSPFTVFSITGVPGAGLSLAISDGTAQSTDHGNDLEFFDLATAQWVAYTPSSPNAIVQTDGYLLVRVAIANDAPYEGSETFNLSATYNSNGTTTTGLNTSSAATGTATIVDDGTGVTFLTRKDDPLTPADESNLGVMDGNKPQLDDVTPKDDDRGVSVADVTVNEGSPFIVFKLDSFVGQKLTVSVGSDTAILGDITSTGVDASSSLQYFDGISWVNYTPGSSIDVNPSGISPLPGDPATVLVRLAVKQDAPYEMSESFTLKASTATGKSDSAIGTIVDNGTGNLFSAVNTSGTPDAPGTNSLPASLDDDRPYNPAFINNLTVNEGSPWAVFTITGVPTAQVTLTLPNNNSPLLVGEAEKGVDYANGLQPGDLQVYIDGQWVDYNPNAPYPSALGTANNGNSGNAVLDASGQLLVRVKLNNQIPLEGAESFSLSLKYTGTFDTSQTTLLPDPNNTFTGNAVIVDDGSGAIFAAGLDDPNTPGIENTGVGSDGKPVLVDPATDPVVDPSAANAPRLADDDRPLAVNNVSVNEASPFIVLAVTGAAGQYIKLETASGTATLGNITAQGNSDDVSSNLEYFDGTAWVAYTPGSYVRIPLAAGQSEDAPQNLLVRLVINNDAPFENSESFNLIATNTGGGSATGTGTIVDNGTGDLFPAGDSDVQRLPSSNLLTIAPTSNPSGLNDDRGITINNLVVNEASPFAVFTVRATEGQPLLLELGSGSATVGTDTGLPLEVYDPVAKAWVAYDSANPPVVPSDGFAGVAADAPLLVRVAISADQLLDMGETFTLKASYTGGGVSATGTATIVDDGSGTIFATRADDPFNPADVPVTGVNPDGTPATLTPATSAVANPNDPTNPALLADDDRPLTVSDLMVNEGSPFAVFSVGAKGGQYVQLTLSPGTASAGDDYANALEYWDPAANSGVGAWSAYIPGTFVKIPGEAIEPATLLVRVAIKVDQLNDNFETFNLTATNTGGSSATGSGTILDDGNGTIFATNTVQPGVNPSGNVPLTLEPTGTSIADPADPITPALLADDDRPLEVNDLTVNEGSPFAVFSVTGKEGQYVQLELIGGTATPDSDEVSGDYSPALEVWDGTGWIGYNPGTFVKIPADPDTIAGEPAVLLVRVAITADTPLDGGETFGLKASNTAGGSDSGTATIVDDGTGTLFGSANTSGTPDVLGTSTDPSLPTALDDDRIITINNLELNENSPFAVFTVSGTASQPISLALSNGTALVGSDYGPSLETFDSLTGQWLPYTAQRSVNLDAAGRLLVRTSIKNDGVFENRETFFLTGQNSGGISARGTATIFDDGKGSLMNPDGSLNTKIYVDDDRPMPASISVPAMQQALCIEDLFASYGMPNILSRLTGGEISRDRIMHNLASIP